MADRLEGLSDEEIAAEMLAELDRRIEAGRGNVYPLIVMRPALRREAARDPRRFAAIIRETLAELDLSDA